MTKKTTKKKVKEKEKAFIKFESALGGDDDSIKLKITYNKKLQDTLRQVAVSGERDFEKYVGTDESGAEKKLKLQRTKVKTVIWRGFSSDGRDLVFIKDLVMNGEVELSFYDVSIMEDTITQFSSNVKRALELITEYSNIEQKITFDVE